MKSDARSAGRLLVFEGPDGAGKSSLLTALAAVLRSQGFEVLCSREPTDGHYGRALREAAKTQRLPPQTELDLLIKDRKEHIETLIAPGLNRGAMVLLDRYYFSTVAYQGSSGLDLDYLLAVNEAFAPKPDLLFLLDLPLEVSLQRIKARGGQADQFEAPETLRRVREIFLSFRDLPYAQLMDAQLSPEILLQQAVQAFDQLLQNRS